MPSLKSPKRLKLSKRELAAASSKGIAALTDDDMVRLLKGRLLKYSKTKFEIERIHGSIRLHLGLELLISDVRLKELSRSELIHQAATTGDLIEALEQRLRHMHKTLEGLASEFLLRRGESVQEIGWRIEPDLVRLRVALRHAAEKLRREPASPGRKSRPGRDRLLAIVVKVLREHSTPKVSIEDARLLAAGYLTDCGIAYPTDERELQKMWALGQRRRGKSGKR